MISVIGTCNNLPSNVGTSTIQPNKAWPNGTGEVNIKSVPSRLKCLCGWSRKINTMSAMKGKKEKYE